VHLIVIRSRPSPSLAPRPSSARTTLLELLISFAIIIVVGYALKQAEIHSRLWFASAFLTAFVVIVVKNRLLQRMTERGVLRDLFTERIALVGDSDIAKLLRQSLEREIGTPCIVRGYDVAARGSDGAATEQELQPLIQDGLEQAFDRIILCLPPDRIGSVKALVDAVSFLPVRIEICLAQAELQALRSDRLLAPGQLLVALDDQPRDDWGDLLKRWIDLAVGGLMLILVAPLMLLVAIAIKLDSRGPVFFRQRRHGWNHSVIKVWKFRTHHTGDGERRPRHPRRGTLAAHEPR
jgi:Bacterial sugar transferase/CoA-binding domain